MAFTRYNSMVPASPLPNDPGVLWAHITNSASETNIPVYVPWDNCQLVHAYTTVTTAIDSTADMEIDLELTEAGGTEIMTISVPKSSAVGTVTEATFTSRAAGRHLKNGSIIMVEVDGSAAAAGAANIYLYFEPGPGAA